MTGVGEHVVYLMIKYTIDATLKDAGTECNFKIISYYQGNDTE